LKLALHSLSFSQGSKQSPAKIFNLHNFISILSQALNLWQVMIRIIISFLVIILFLFMIFIISIEFILALALAFNFYFSAHLISFEPRH